MNTPNGMHTVMRAEEDIADLAKDAVRLLNVSTFTEQERQAWIALVPEMSFDDIVKFLEILELDVYGKVRSAIDPIVTQVEAIKHGQDIAAHALNTQYLQSLEDIKMRIEREERKLGKKAAPYV